MLWRIDVGLRTGVGSLVGEFLLGSHGRFAGQRPAVGQKHNPPSIHFLEYSSITLNL